MVDSSTLHRGAKYFMDSGRAATHDEAMAMLRSFGLAIHVGEAVGSSRDQQVALLTLVNVARRSFLAGVEVVGLPNAKPLTRLTRARSLARALEDCGGRVVRQANPAWPAAIIGEAPKLVSGRPAWRLTWSGWRGGVIPAGHGEARLGSVTMPLSPMLAAMLCRGSLRLSRQGSRDGRISSSRSFALESRR